MLSLWRDYLEVADKKDKAAKPEVAKSAAKPPVAKAKAEAKQVKTETAAKDAVAKKTTAKPKKVAVPQVKPQAKAQAEPEAKKEVKAVSKEAKPKATAKAKSEAAPTAKASKKAPKTAGDYVPRLKVYYKDKVIPYMIDKFEYSNTNMVPKLSKISINSRVSTARDEVKDLESITDDISVVSGQKAVVTRAKKAIANFKIRQGDPVGATVTIRGSRMYEFLDRMISIAIPRVRDFNGLREKSFDGFGNFSFGVKEQIIFPEIDYDKVNKIRGMDITIVTTANTDEEGYELLKSLGMPFRILETAEPGN